MKLYQAVIISLLFVALMLGMSNPASAAVTISWEAGTSAGWNFYELDGDIARNNTIDWADLSVIAQYWLNSSCDGTNQWCGGADIDDSTGVI